MSKYIIQKPIDPKDMSAKALQKAANLTSYVIQPKYDGCAAVVWLLPDGGFSIWSATGERVRSCDHIAIALIKTFGRPETAIAYVGEVWKFDTAFKDISGAFRRHAAQPDLLFVPYDVVRTTAGSAGSPPELADTRSYTVRANVLWNKGKVYAPGLVQCPTFPAATTNARMYARQLKELGGYDGAMLVALGDDYKVGRCRNAERVKEKPLIELDLRVVGLKADKGAKTGKNTLALQVLLEDDKTGFVSTGLTQGEIDLFVATPSAIVGQIIAVEAMDWTEDGLLREPRYKGIRHDKVAADF